jgi:hypothetical protein
MRGELTTESTEDTKVFGVGVERGWVRQVGS